MRKFETQIQTYTGCSPMIKKMVNDRNERINSCKVGEKHEEKKAVKTEIKQSVNSNINTACPVCNYTTVPYTKNPRSKTLQTAVDRFGYITVKPWRTLWRHEKIARAFEAVGRTAGGVAFTANLSATREAFLMKRADPVDDIRRRMASELRKVFSLAVPLAFTFEISPKGKLHIHGVAILPFANKRNQALLKEAMELACGKSKGKAAARQIDIAEITDGTGWAAYSQKDHDTACNYLGTDKINFISNEIIRIAKG